MNSSFNQKQGVSRKIDDIKSMQKPNNSGIFDNEDEDNESDPDDEDDVMRELEDFVKPKKLKKNKLGPQKQKIKDKIPGGTEEDDDVYDMCDQMLEDLNYLDAQL